MNKERFEELLGLLLDEEITGEQLEELAKLVAESSDVSPSATPMVSPLTAPVPEDGSTVS